MNQGACFNHKQVKSGSRRVSTKYEYRNDGCSISTNRSFLEKNCDVIKKPKSKVIVVRQSFFM